MNKTKEFHTSSFLPFDPLILLLDILKRWLLVILAAATVGVGAYIVADTTYEPVYRTNTVFVVTTQGSSTTVYNNLTSTSNVATLFTELLNSSLMRKTITQELGVSYLNAQIDTSVVPNTNLINMTVTSSDPRTAFLTAQALIEHHESLTYTIVDGIIMEVLQQPSVPTAPINSANAMGQMKRMGILAAVAAAVLIAVFSSMSNKVRSGEEAKQKLDCHYLGEIPHERKHKTLASLLRRRKTSVLITNPAASFRYVETVHKLRRRVEQHTDGGQVLMVTSLLENEGKSTVAVNLALSLAQKHERVLLIDCDLRKPACHFILDHKKFGSGVKEVLQGKASLSESVLRHEPTQLYLLLARKGDQNVGDLLSGERMRMLLDWARKNFTYVILDTPPMTAAADAEATVALADAGILVVCQNTAPAPALNKAISALEGSRSRLLGCVLNNVRSSRLSGSGYGSYHKYHYYNSGK